MTTQSLFLSTGGLINQEHLFLLPLEMHLPPLYWEAASLKIQSLKQHELATAEALPLLSPLKQLRTQLVPEQIIHADVFMGRRHEHSQGVFGFSPLQGFLLFFKEEVHCGKQCFMTYNKNPCKDHFFWPKEAKYSFRFSPPLCIEMHTVQR